MNKTKKKIIDCATTLFNKNGIADVSLRDISSKAKISIGNLQYHFKKREDIVEAIYFEMVEEMTEAIQIEKDQDLLTAFFDSSVMLMSTLYTYRFFVLDFVTITRRNEKIKQHYATVSSEREENFLSTVNTLIDEGLFRPQALKNEYAGLYKRLEVLSNFWFSNLSVQNSQLEEACIKEYAVLVGQSIFPYLTDKAKQAFTG